MATPSPEAILTGIRKALEGTRYECSSFERLSGGTANFIYRARLASPLEDGTAEVVLKHGEGFVANNPHFKIAVSRSVRLHGWFAV
jgi:hypothetical protein